MAELLKSADSLESLHEVMLAVAGRTAGGGSRWARTQVLHFLRPGLRAAAEQYFDGERLRAAEDFPRAPTSLDARALADALDRCADHLGRDGIEQADGDVLLPPLAAGLRELLARPEPQGNTPIACMLRALREEMRAADAKQPKRFRLSGGRCVRGVEGRFVYQFTWSSEPDPHAPGELWVGREAFAARVGDSAPDDALRYELVVDEWLGEEVSGGTFRIDPTFLLRSVYEKLETADRTAEDAGLWASRLTSAPEPVVATAPVAPSLLDGLNERQRAAVRTSIAVNRGYVWGPPGTGKTTTIGALARALVSQGRRVLILSPYNVAVDEAVISAARAAGAAHVLRIGRAGAEVRHLGLDLDSRLERHAEATGLLQVARDLLAAAMAEAPGQRVSPPGTVRACLDQLGSLVVRRYARRGDPEARQLVASIRRLRRAFWAPEGRLLQDAGIVGSTMALAFLKQGLFDRPFDHLIVDEASVVRSPEAVVAAACAAARVTFFGDPKQLPAIVLAGGDQAARWLGRSPFAMAGIESPSHAGGACVMLQEQQRMAPPIREVVSELFYEGSLKDGEHAPAGGRVVVLDTSATGARATPKLVRLSQSKENLLHRSIVAEILRATDRWVPGASALVLAPFVAQKRAYRREPTTRGAVRAGARFETIHTSQGTEQEVVVLDLVLAGTGVGTRSRMLDDHSNPHLANLLNVAVSRARSTLVVVGDLSLISREYEGGLLERLVATACRSGVSVQVQPRLTGLRQALEGIFMS